jgi:hypothetical protein
MYCLKELAQSYGRDPVKLSPEHAWERGTYGPYDACNGRSCDRLQKIVKGNGRRERDMRHVMSTASNHTTVILGGDFSMDPQIPCNPIVLVRGTTATRAGTNSAARCRVGANVNDERREERDRFRKWLRGARYLNLL